MFDDPDEDESLEGMMYLIDHAPELFMQQKEEATERLLYSIYEATRRKAFGYLNRLPETFKIEFIEVSLCFLVDSDFKVRCAVVQFLSHIPLSTLAQHREGLAFRLWQAQHDKNLAAVKRRVPNGLRKLVGRVGWYLCRTKFLLQRITEPWAMRAWAPGKRTHEMLCRAHETWCDDVRNKALCCR